MVKYGLLRVTQNMIMDVEHELELVRELHAEMVESATSQFVGELLNRRLRVIEDMVDEYGSRLASQLYHLRATYAEQEVKDNG